MRFFVYLCSKIMLNNKFEYEKIEDESNGYIVPIGGGKDSVVTLETLNLDINKQCYQIKPNK